MIQEAPRKQPALIPSELKLADYNRNRFLARPPVGTTLEDILNPAFWAHVAGQLTPGGGDIIELFPIDGAYYAELIVAECRRTGMVNQVRLVKLSYTPLSEEIVQSRATAGGYKIVHRGTEKKHTVTRIEDNVIVSEGHATKQDAQKWIDEQELDRLTQ